MLKKLIVFFCLFISTLQLGACSPNPVVTSSQEPAFQAIPIDNLPTETNTPLPIETTEPSPSPIDETPNPTTIVTTDVSIPTIIETGDILRISFPTPGQPPVSFWRPPLYPIPWGLAPNDHFLFIRPISADVVNWALPNYRYGGIFTGTDIVHTGIDIDAPIETPVHAAGSGTIRWAGYGLYMNDQDKDDPYGLAVAIEHDFSYQGQKLYTIYAHLDRVDVKKGQHVNTGDPIGIVGNTGNTTGPHLHFEIRLADNNYYTTRNPELWLSPPQGWGVLAGRIMWSGGSLLEKKSLKVASLSTGQTWEVITYGPLAVNRDDHYQENMALSDLPAGDYEISLLFYGKKYSHTFSIQPGAVIYLTFQGIKGFNNSVPPTPSPEEWLVVPHPSP